MTVGSRNRLRWWEMLTWTVLALVVAHALVMVTTLAVLIRDYAAHRQLPASTSASDVLRVSVLREFAPVLAPVGEPLFFGCLLGYVGWFIASRRLTARLVGPLPLALRHWTVSAWRAAIVVSAVLMCAHEQPFVDPDTQSLVREDLLNFDRGAILLAICRLVAAAFAGVSMVVIRKDIRSLAQSHPMDVWRAVHRT